MKIPIISWHARLACVALASTVLASCAVNPNGPVGPGGSRGTLGSPNMSDYFYHKDAGWTYAFTNVEKIYNSDGSVAATLDGSNDTVRTMGYDQLASNGDSLFRYQISYRVANAYAGRPFVTINYVSATHADNTHGAFVLPGDTVSGMSSMSGLARAVSADTILSGIGGYVRTTVDDFNDTGNYTWQTDTIWYSEHLDSAFIWEREGGTGPIIKERCVFLKDFHTNETWDYDVINEPNPTTSCDVIVDDESWTVPAGTWNHTADIRIKTSAVDDYDFNREYKYYGCFAGPIYQYDWWYVTADGNSFTKEDFTRSLISLTHN